jgi:phage gp29-like protein
MNIFNWFKKEITPAAVKAQQTDLPQAVQLHREFENHPARGLTPARLAQIFLSAEQGDLTAQAELFHDMEEKDTHIGSELWKRKMAVKKVEWMLEPPRNASAKEKKNTLILEELIRDELDIGAIRFDALDAIGHGYSCLELGWSRTKAGYWLPRQVEHRPPSWFTVPQADRNTLHLRTQAAIEGEPLQPWGWIVHQHKSRSGYLPRAGLHRSLAWPFLFKNYSVRDLAEFLEIYGLPIRLGKYPAAAGDSEKRALMNALLSIGHHAAGIIPESMQVELATVTGGGSGGESFKIMIEWCEGAVSKAILGATLTSGTAANGNRALGDVHNEVRLDIRDDDAAQLDQTLGTFLIYPIAMLNGLFDDDRSPSFKSDTQEPEDLKLYAEALPPLVNVGARIPARWINQKLKIPEPQGDEPILQAAPQVQPQPPKAPASDDAAAALAALAADPNITPREPALAPDTRLPARPDNAGRKDDDNADPTPVTALTEQLAAEAGEALKGLVDTIRAKVEAADSFAALRDDLLASYAELDSNELTRVMALAFAAADLSGRYDVQQGD